MQRTSLGLWMPWYRCLGLQSAVCRVLQGYVCSQVGRALRADHGNHHCFTSISRMLRAFWPTRHTLVARHWSAMLRYPRCFCVASRATQLKSRHASRACYECLQPCAMRLAQQRAQMNKLRTRCLRGTRCTHADTRPECDLARVRYADHVGSN